MRLRIVTAALCVGLIAGYAQEKPARPTRPMQKDTPPAAMEMAKPVAEKPEPLSEKEQSELARRAEEPGREVAGGALSNLHLTYIVIALAAAVLVLVLK